MQRDIGYLLPVIRRLTVGMITHLLIAVTTGKRKILFRTDAIISLQRTFNAFHFYLTNIHICPNKHIVGHGNYLVPDMIEIAVYRQLYPYPILPSFLPCQPEIILVSQFRIQFRTTIMEEIAFVERRCTEYVLIGSPNVEVFCSERLIRHRQRGRPSSHVLGRSPYPCTVYIV